MKKVILLAAAFGLVFAASAQAQMGNSITGSGNSAAGTTIVGSKHDLSRATGIGTNYGNTDTLDRICIFCHAPHHTLQKDDAANITYLPLWNHAVTSQFYTTYDSNFGGGPDESGLAVGVAGAEQFADRHLLNAQIGEPGSVSRLCLSCHDGSVAVNEYGFNPQRSNSQDAGSDFIAEQFMIGGSGNLVNHHPIGFDYQDVADHDDEIAQTSKVFPGTGNTTIGSLLYAGKMECVTCHDVHNTKNQGETFLWISDENSKFCLVCHLK